MSERTTTAADTRPIIITRTCVINSFGALRACANDDDEKTLIIVRKKKQKRCITSSSAGTRVPVVLRHRRCRRQLYTRRRRTNIIITTILSFIRLLYERCRYCNENGKRDGRVSHGLVQWKTTTAPYPKYPCARARHLINKRIRDIVPSYCFYVVTAGGLVRVVQPCTVDDETTAYGGGAPVTVKCVSGRFIRDRRNRAVIIIGECSPTLPAPLSLKRRPRLKGRDEIRPDRIRRKSSSPGYTILRINNERI